MAWLKRGLLLILLGGVGAGAYWAFQPQPVLVDVEEVLRGPLEVTINEDGKTRIKEKYIVSTPVAGRLQRIEFREGDRVTTGSTVVATIQPSNPSLLDARTLAQAKARVSAADAAVNRAESRLAQTEIDLKQAKKEYDDAEELFQSKSISETKYELAKSKHQSCEEQKKAASFDRDIAIYELKLAQSALLHVQPGKDGKDHLSSSEFFAIRSPIDGVVLRVLQESSTIVTPGTPIMELGDPDDLEIVVDLLSSDAVKIGPGTQVKIEQWGGANALTGVVRLVEPSAFLKISALGVEEQRVNVVVDFELPSENSGRIGDGYRVEARMITNRNENVLKVKTSALFREQNRWAVFVLQDKKVKLTFVEIGQRNDQEAEVLGGLTEGQQVVMQPSRATTSSTKCRPKSESTSRE